MQKFSSQFYFKLFEKIVLIRKCEDLIKKYYKYNDMKTPMHMSMGEELVVSAAVQVFSKKSDYFGYYRSHALYLSLIKDPKGFFGEMHGRESGENKGVAGSMHISNPKKNLKAVSAIVATTIPVAVGNSYGNFLNRNNKLTISFFGDGATEEGVFFESINFASLKKLPIIFICLNNKIAVDVDIKKRQSYSISQIAKSCKIKTYDINSFQIDKVCKIYSDALNYHKKTKKPVFINANYYRYLQHIGINTDFDNSNSSFERQDYRMMKDHKNFIKKNDPFDLIKRKMIKIKGENYVKNYENKMSKNLENILKKTLKDKYLSEKIFKDHVYN